MSDANLPQAGEGKRPSVRKLKRGISTVSASKVSKDVKEEDVSVDQDICCVASPGHNELTHWELEKMHEIWQMTILNAFQQRCFSIPLSPSLFLDSNWGCCDFKPTFMKFSLITIDLKIT